METEELRYYPSRKEAINRKIGTLEDVGPLGVSCSTIEGLIELLTDSLPRSPTSTIFVRFGVTLNFGVAVLERDS